MVDARGILLIRGARILGEAGLEQGGGLGIGGGQNPLGIADVQAVPLALGGVARGGIGVRVREGEVGLDVVDRCAVEKIHTRNGEDRPLLALLTGEEPYRGKPDGIRAEGRSAGKNADVAVAAEAGRADGRGKALAVGKREIKKKPEVGKLLDAAQGVGAIWNGVSICALGDAASISCQNSKNLTCGEGGIITTNDDALAAAISTMLAGGQKDGQYVSVGQDHTISEFQASVLLSQYEKLQDEMYLREKNAAYLAGRLKDLDFVDAAGYDERITRHAYHLFVVRFRSEKLAERGVHRDKLLEAIQAEGVPLYIGYLPLYRFPCVTSDYTERQIGAKIDTTPLPNCERASYDEGCWLYQACLLGTRQDMDDIADAIIKVWEHADELK